MTRFKRTFIILLFTLGFIVIMLVGLLVPFFGLENSYKEALTNVALNINSNLNSENQEEILSYFKSYTSDTILIVIFRLSSSTILSHNREPCNLETGIWAWYFSKNWLLSMISLNL